MTFRQMLLLFLSPWFTDAEATPPAPRLWTGQAGFVYTDSGFLTCPTYDELWNKQQPGRWVTVEDSSGTCDVEIRLTGCAWIGGACRCEYQVLAVGTPGDCDLFDIEDVEFPPPPL